MGPFLKDNEKTIGDTAQLVADSAKALRHNLGTLVKTAPVAAKGARAASDTLDDVYKARCEDRGTAGPGLLRPEEGRRTAADDVATIADDVNTLIGDQNGDLKKLDKNLATLQTQAQALADRAPHLSEDLDDAVSKINKLNEGAAKVAAGAKKLHTGLGTAKTGAADLDDGHRQAQDGRRRPSTAACTSSPTAPGSSPAGCTTAPSRSPTTTSRTATGAPRSWPTRSQLASRDLHKAPNYGTGFAPYFIPLSLWVGAMVAYMLIPPMNRRALAAGAPAWRIALAGWLPVVAIGVLQTVALMSVLHWAIGLQTGAGGRHGRLPVPGDGVLRGDRAVAERALRGGGPDPRPRPADAPADLRGRHVPRADQSGLLQRDPPLPADELRRRGPQEAHHGRRPGTGVARVRGARRPSPRAPSR